MTNGKSKITENIKPDIKKHLSAFRITQERQKKVYHDIRENAKADFDFFILLIFSTIIIALGLVINSSAVVIGGMLIAPLVWPVLAMALAIVKGSSRLLGEAAVALFKSSLIILLVSIVLGLLIPQISNENSEILSRTQPQLYELFIALVSGFIGAFVVTFPKLGGAMAGVVVAAALVPPLAAMGLLIADRDLAGAGGAFLLYTSNLIALTLSAAVLFFFSRFRGPATEEAQQQQKSNLVWSVIFLIVIAIPLVLITSDTVKQQKRSSVVQEVLEAKLESIQLQEVHINKEGEVLIVDVTLRSPNNIHTYQVEELTTILSNQLEESVVLKISVIPVIEAGKLVPSENAILNTVTDPASAQPSFQ